MNQTVRIIGGRYRGKKLHFPAVPGLRPTPDRVRETLFNWLMHDIRNARCLDAFAGSGALGLEAFSRGASAVTFLERNHLVCANLNKMVSTFNTPNLHVIQTDALAYFKQNNASQFDIIFLDPPFSSDYLPSIINELSINSTLIQGGLVYIESRDKLVMDCEFWEAIHVKQAGQVVYSLYRKSA